MFRAAARLPFSHVSWKICAPYVVLSLLVAAAGTFIATQLVTGSLQERFDNQLAEAARVTSDSTVRLERAHLSLVRSIAFTDDLPERVAAGDSQGVLALVEPLAVNANAEFVEVVGADGKRLVGLHHTGEQGYQTDLDSLPRGDWGLVADVLSGKRDDTGDKFAQVVQTPQGIVLYTSGPVKIEDRVVGTVLVGSLLDSFLPLAKRQALADITFYDFNGRPLPRPSVQ